MLNLSSTDSASIDPATAMWRRQINMIDAESSSASPSNKASKQTAQRQPKGRKRAVLPFELRAPIPLPIDRETRRRLVRMRALVAVLDSGPRADGWPHNHEDEESDRSLARRATTEDAALFQLIERDKRYLASELVQARLVEWTLLKRLAQLRLPTEDGKSRYASRGAWAERQLDKCARAVRSPDEAQTVLLEPFAEAFTSTRSRIEGAVQLLRDRKWPSLTMLAKRCGIEETVAEMLNRTSRRPAIVEATLLELSRHLYRDINVSPKTLRRYYDSARFFSLL